MLRGWVGDEPEVPEAAFIEVFDSQEEAPRAGEDRMSQEGGTVGFLLRRFPTVSMALGGERPADTFWLAAWWLGGPQAGRSSHPAPPTWIPRPLLEQGDRLADACRAALQDPGSVEDLRQLDARVGPRTLLGEQIGAALDLAHRGGLEVAEALFGERLLRHPLRLAASELVLRLAGDWQLAERLPEDGLDVLGAGHVLLQRAELSNLDDLVGAARRLAKLERALEPVGCKVLVEEVYPEYCAPVPDLISRAQLGAARGGLVAAEPIAAFEASANRLLRSADSAFREAAAAGFPGCLRIWEVGEATVAPLLRGHLRVAVLLVDAMRVDLWLRLRQSLQEMFPARRMMERWAVVPEPTRTAEAVAALYLGHPVPAGGAPEQAPPPFSHLGYESRAMTGADRDVGFEDLLEFWSTGPPLAVAVAGGVDERLHRSPVELSGLLDEAVAGLSRRLFASLRALPADVPLVILADHGFRENREWGRGREGRYAHGGLSLEESVVPVVVLETPD